MMAALPTGSFPKSIPRLPAGSYRDERATILGNERGRVAVVARRHEISRSLLHEWRSVRRAAGGSLALGARGFIQIGVWDGSDGTVSFTGPILRQGRCVSFQGIPKRSISRSSFRRHARQHGHRFIDVVDDENLRLSMMLPVQPANVLSQRALP